MESENLQRAWELIGRKVAQESDPQKHLKLIDELLRVMSDLQASRAENKRRTTRNEKKKSWERTVTTSAYWSENRATN